ncbi:MAG: neutral zinc metallopeptidase [Actinomycetes bacterium]
MRWQRGTSDADIDDRRGSSGSSGGRGGGIRLGLGGIIVVGILSLVFKQNFFSLLDQVPAGTTASTSSVPGGPVATTAEERERFEFVKFVLNDTQDTWTKLLPAEGSQYKRAKLVVFRNAIESACGYAESASGPFYCPGDHNVYIDLAFYDELKQRFGAAGDFAQAYVIAHEIGHHVQNLLGIEEQVRRTQQSRPNRTNDLSVRMELQADCFAGVWGYSTSQRQLLESGDVEEGLNAAAAIGDDRIQKMSTGRVMPEKFTHGSSAQRVAWFRKGLDSGKPSVCDTFSGR